MTRKVYSHTKRSTLEKCPRQYFYEYYAGQVEPAPAVSQGSLFAEMEADHRVIDQGNVERVRELKKLSSAYQVAGVVLHNLIAQHWREPSWNPEWFVKQAAERFDHQAASAPERKTLLERYYGLDDAEATIAEARSRLLLAIQTYFANPAVSALVDELLNGEEHFAEQKLGGLPKVREFTIMGQVDGVSRRGDHVQVVDWKMGRSVGDEDSLQLVLYGWWAAERFQVAPECASVRRVFLGDGVVESPLVLSGPLLDRGRARLGQDVERMEELHEYGVSGNLDAFPPCEQERVCRQCKYQGVCPAVACATL